MLTKTLWLGKEGKPVPGVCVYFRENKLLVF